MPMSPRLLRPRASNANVASDSDARAYIEAVRLADGQYMEAAVQLAVNSFVAGCKTDGIWSAIKASCLLMGARTLSGALTPLVGAAPTNNFFVSGDYNRRGLLGDGATKFLNTNRANNADPRDNQHFSVWIAQASTQVAASIGASTAATAGSSAIGQDSTVYTFRSRHAGAAGGVSSTAATSTGFFGASRANSASYDYRAAGLAGSFSIASDAPTSVTLNVFVTNGGAAFSNGRIAFYSIGESLDLALLDARVTALVNAIGAAIP